MPSITKSREINIYPPIINTVPRSKYMMKRILSVVFALILAVLTLASCGKESNTEKLSVETGVVKDGEFGNVYIL